MLEYKLFFNCTGGYTGNCGGCGRPMTTDTESTENGGFHTTCDPDADSDD